MIRLAIIGTGGMARAHAQRYKAIPGCRVVACCDVIPGRAGEFAKTHGIPAAYDDFKPLLKNEKLDAVSIVTSDRAHMPVALAAIRYGLHVMCEKPLADTLGHARRMTEAAKKKGVLTAVNFSYRNYPSTQKAVQVVQSGTLGRIIHVEGSYLQTWLTSPVWGDWHTTTPFLWRLSGKHGSMGVLGDIGVHLYDLAHFVVGPFASLVCELKTFDKGLKRIGEYVFDVNDSLVTTVRFANGALGVLHATRWATGHANTVSLRVFGDKGAIDLNLSRPPEDQLRICQGPKAMLKLEWAPVACPPVPDMYERFVKSIKTRKQGQTSFASGLQIQAYLESSFIAAERGGFVKIKT